MQRRTLFYSLDARTEGEQTFLFAHFLSFVSYLSFLYLQQIFKQKFYISREEEKASSL
jgi:hypothetical protein